ncbi:hypothetical protein SAMN04488101_105179 [Pedobacter nyackensis]|uniref:Uncharacterized protein n=1 Tax=Pedobacter nyackensis TaxID=475255 RepID=A0A1W2D136_9SPHI|nr:hypothetical protein SAMN04488101_105179 [Pedobacter nyackensis]
MKHIFLLMILWTLLLIYLITDLQVSAPTGTTAFESAKPIKNGKLMHLSGKASGN